MRYIALTLAVLAAIGIAVYGSSERIRNALAAPDQASPAAGVTTAAVQVLARPVEITANDQVFEAIGTGRARRSVQIYPAASGEVVEVAFEAGAAVAKGAVLMRLDDADELLAVRLAEVELEDARTLLGRYEQAVKGGAAPQSELDAARAAVMAAEVGLDQARLRLEERFVRAPFAGHVGIPAVDPGDRADTSTLITGLDDRSVLHVDFEVPEKLTGVLIDDAPAARAVQATTPAYPDREFEGRISATEARIDPDRRTLRVRATLANENDVLRPGMSFNTRWSVPGRSYPTVPEIALQWSADGSFVWVVRDGRADRLPVNVVARRYGSVLIDGGLRADDRVVVEGVQRLKPGTAVRELSEERT